ncbi:hypothetical protein VNO80_31631 [Phaseolus coccineus]|uniref:Anthranilate synthase component I N-terminal domain-containing protein n=1 Tax=Phaseolus coccineus TaxID=3886 RepID=A0AAN9L0I7_PHACN
MPLAPWRCPHASRPGDARIPRAWRFEQDDLEAPSFLFESIDPEEDQASIWVKWYSVVGANPTIEIVVKENKVTIIDHESGNLTQKDVDDPIMVLKQMSEDWKPSLIDRLPNAFCGYFSYDTARGLILVASSAEIITHTKVNGDSQWDALRFALPLATLTGAPKRALRGGFGCMSFLGVMHIALAMRPMTLETKDHDQSLEHLVYIQSSAGVSADSVNEYLKCEGLGYILNPDFSFVKIAAPYAQEPSRYKAKAAHWATAC